MKLLILDRDGVINHDSDEYIKNPDEWRPVPGSLDAIAQLIGTINAMNAQIASAAEAPIIAGMSASISLLDDITVATICTSL